MKRLLDFAVAALALVVLSPLLLLIAALVALESGLPVLFRQRRIGRGGTEFEIWKFRSMVQDADRIGPWHTQDEDPRITRVGRLLRRTSLDELPQLVNVLRGEMSLVGPRPDVPAQRSLYGEEEWRVRHTVRPGITGLAQALLRSEATPRQRLDLDLRYVREHSCWFDLRILAWTLRRITGRGSN